MFSTNTQSSGVSSRRCSSRFLACEFDDRKRVIPVSTSARSTSTRKAGVGGGSSSPLLDVILGGEAATFCHRPTQRPIHLVLWRRRSSYRICLSFKFI